MTEATHRRTIRSWAQGRRWLDEPTGCGCAALPRLSRRLLLVATIGLSIGSSGCSVWHLAHRTMYSELAEYPQITDGRLACRQYRRWANDEWQRVLQEQGGQGLSSDYGSGFVQGFVDQVDAGGSVRVPSMPPRKYWRVGYRNPRGQQAVEDWYDGFRHGAGVAKAGGYRRQAVIPSSLQSHSTADDPALTEDLESSPQRLESSKPPVTQEPLERAKEHTPTPAKEAPGEELPKLVPDEVGPADAEQLPAPSEQALPQVTPPTGNDVLPPPPVEDLKLDVPLDELKPFGEPSSAPDTDLSALRSAARTPQPPRKQEPEPPSSDVPAVEPQPDRPATEPRLEGPPPPPWHRSAKARKKSSESKRAEPQTSDSADFDPFAGTPFKETLGLTNGRAAATQVSSAAAAGGSTVRDPHVQPAMNVIPVPDNERQPASADSQVDWQPAPATASSWKHRE